MDDFERELKMGFLEEATQLMSDTEQCFLQLETSSGDPSLLEKIFRLAHNLKGSAKAVGFDDLGEFTHQLESLLLKMKNGEIAISASAVNLLLRCNDQIVAIIAGLKTDPANKIDSSALLAEIQDNINGKVTVAAGIAEPPESEQLPSGSHAGFEDDTPVQAEVPPEVQAATEAVDPVVAEVPAPVPVVEQVAVPVVAPAVAVREEAPAVPAAASAQPVAQQPSQQQPAQQPGGAGAPPAAVQAADESIRVSLNRLERLINFVGEMVILQSVLREQVQASESMLMRKTVHQLVKVTKEVQDISMGLRMVPLKQTFQKMQRIVRDTSAKLDKKISLRLVGEDTEVDKTILESLGDPLVHLVRNSVDHGVESPEVRKATGKSETGEIVLNAYHKGGNLILEVRDDGAGLNPEKLLAKAVEKGIHKPGTKLSDEDAYQLIFHSGFSTKAAVTDVSGRGVGMDVVKTNIERLQGSIQIETKVGKGTCFRVVLPLTLAIIDGMTIQCEKERYVIPLAHVHESMKPTASDIHFVTGLGEVFSLRGESLPLYRLSELLGKKSVPRPLEEMIAIVVRVGKSPFSILVDDIVGQSQIVIKQLGQEHQNLKGFSGSAILGDGKPSLILELTELVGRYKPTTVTRSNETRRTAA